MANVNKRYFESLMQSKSLSLRGLAQRMNMSHSQLSLTFGGDRKMQLDEAAQLAFIFGEPLHRIVENAGVSVVLAGPQRVTVVGAVQGDGTVSIHGRDIVERTNAPAELPDGSVALQCRTGGTPLDWMDGWVFFCAAPTQVEPATLGRFSYCKIKDGPAVIATVKRGYREQTYNLAGPIARESILLDWATPVLWTRN